MAKHAVASCFVLKAGIKFSLVFPSDLFEKHLSSARSNHLFLSDLLIIENEKGKNLRHIASFKKQESIFKTQQMIVKYSSGLYSKTYVELTKEFHNKKLQFKA